MNCWCQPIAAGNVQLSQRQGEYQYFNGSISLATVLELSYPLYCIPQEGREGEEAELLTSMTGFMVKHSRRVTYTLSVSACARFPQQQRINL